MDVTLDLCAILSFYQLYYFKDSFPSREGKQVSHWPHDRNFNPIIEVLNLGNKYVNYEILQERQTNAKSMVKAPSSF